MEKQVAVIFSNFKALSDEYPQETPHWPNLITNLLKLFGLVA